MMSKQPLKLIPVTLLASVVLTSLPVAAWQSAERQTTRVDRLSPPTTLACDRNQLTSYNGKVTYYTRGTDSTSITISTDWDSVETLTIKHPAPDGPRHYFLLNGQEFKKSDWERIEVEPGELLKNIRVIAWVCSDGKTSTVIDWRPL